MLEFFSNFLLGAEEETIKYKVITILNLGGFISLESVEFIEELVIVEHTAYPQTQSIFNDELIFKDHFVLD